ncbi:Uncharacterised protein [Bordetella pertussis]|nr:Uncharacterised protein [Bordetella pertussis]
MAPATASSTISAGPRRRCAASQRRAPRLAASVTAQVSRVLRQNSDSAIAR